MTFWIDAMLDPTLAEWLGSRFGVIAKPLRELGLRDAEDIALFQAARRFNQIVIVSRDSDFAELVTQYGSPPQILWLRIVNQPTISLQILLGKTFPEALRILETGEALVEIADSTKTAE